MPFGRHPLKMVRLPISPLPQSTMTQSACQTSVSVAGLEPATLCLKGRCSTPELHALDKSLLCRRYDLGANQDKKKPPSRQATASPTPCIPKQVKTRVKLIRFGSSSHKPSGATRKPQTFQLQLDHGRLFLYSIRTLVENGFDCVDKMHYMTIFSVQFQYASDAISRSLASVLSGGNPPHSTRSTNRQSAAVEARNGQRKISAPVFPTSDRNCLH
jgi:hypothetical protein